MTPMPLQKGIHQAFGKGETPDKKKKKTHTDDSQILI